MNQGPPGPLHKRLLQSKRPMEVAKDFPENGYFDSPMILRKGRNTFATLCKEGGTRKFYDNIVETFKEKTTNAKTSRLTYSAIRFTMFFFCPGFFVRGRKL